MPAQIENDQALIRKVFEWWFKVPEYQRPYVWGSDEVSDLLDDITNAYHSSPNGQYFLGSIVFQRKTQIDSHGGSYDELDLLDGQQRLTTCLLIHAAARDLATVAPSLTPAEQKSLHDTCHSAIFQEANSFSGVPQRIRIVYNTRTKVRDFVKKFVELDGATNNVVALEDEKNSSDTSVRHMAAALLQIREYFEQRPALLKDFIIFFRNNVLLIYVASATLEDAFRLFTVLNDRGMKLRNSDILKTKNLGVLRDEGATKQEIENSALAWETMENELGEDFDAFLSHVRTVLVKEQARKTLLEEFEENIYKPKNSQPVPLLKPGRETFEVLKKYRNHYSEIITGNNWTQSEGYTFDNLITLLQKTSKADYWLPPLLFYREAFGLTGIVSFLKKLENKFMAGWVMRDTPSTRSEAMNRVLRNMDEIKQDATRTDDQKRQAVISLPSLDVDVNGIIQHLRDEDVYGKPYASYILYKLDLIIGGTQTRLQPPQNLSVEHILPQNPASNSLWSQHFTSQDRQDWTHRLGNLVIIGRRKNSSLGRKDFVEKKNTYFQANVLPFPNTIQAIQSPQWTLTELQNNHSKVIAKLTQWLQ